MQVWKAMQHGASALLLALLHDVEVQTAPPPAVGKSALRGLLWIVGSMTHSRATRELLDRRSFINLRVSLSHRERKTYICRLIFGQVSVQIVIWHLRHLQQMPMRWSQSVFTGQGEPQGRKSGFWRVERPPPDKAYCPQH